MGIDRDINDDLSSLPVSAAVKAFVVREQTLLAVRKSAGDMYYAHQWDLPGGHVESGETEIDALKREIWEETGLNVAVAPEPFTETAFAHPPKQPVRQIHVSAYLGLVDNAAGNSVSTANQVASDYIDQVKWIHFADLKETKFIAALRPIIDDFTAKFVTSEVA